ncbi:unnamed protein product [Mytilus coruscus]|uniref:Uncharacterized protein n=1 Tax=Mytilus coruscus TaxID=42192 RepID=A0A6J8B7H4_MYTCO|nr:unnamed protein product [Mytilus coruscus]
MLYEITLTTVEKLERTINKHLRKWLGVPPSFTTVGLYSRTAKLQLPLTSIVEEFKLSKTRLVMTLKESRDDKVRTAAVQVRTGRKWSASKAVSEAESRLRQKYIVGTVAVGRQSLVIEKQRKDAKHIRNKPIKIQFVKEGEVCQKSKQNISGMLNLTRDCHLEIELGKKQQFPDIVPTNLRPNMVLWSTSSKIVIIIELTERCDEVNERKRAKYDGLFAECRDKRMADMELSC